MIVKHKIIDDYIRAANEHATDAMLACFADGAVVYDDGQELHSKDEIKRWIDTTTKEYQATLQVTNVVSQGDEIVVDAQTSGNFEGSPFPFKYYFNVVEDKINRLKIHFDG